MEPICSKHTNTQTRKLTNKYQTISLGRTHTNKKDIREEIAIDKDIHNTI